MSNPNSTLDRGFPGSPAGNVDAIAPTEADWQGLRHDLVDAQVAALRMYLEKQPPLRMVGAVERLIECTRASFRQEELLMECLTSQSDLRLRARHEAVIGQLEALRDSALSLDRGRLLAQLIVVDRELTSHTSGTARVPLARPQVRQSAPAVSEKTDLAAHH